MGKSRRRTPQLPEGPDRLSMTREEVKRQLDDRLRIGREVQSAHYKSPGDLFAAVDKWSGTTTTAIDNLFIGSKTLSQFKAAGWIGIGIVYESATEQMADALDRHRSRLHALEAIIEALPYMREATPEMEEQPQPWRDRPVTIHLQSGNVNLGTVVGDVTSNVSTITGPDSEKVKTLMERLAALVVDSDLDSDTKTEAAESVEVLSEALKQGKAQKVSAIVRSAVRRLPSLLQTVDQGLKVWNELHPLLGQHLPPGTVG